MNSINGIQNVCVIGLGLIGGSLAKALHRSYTHWKIIGVDINKRTIDQALKDDVIQEGYINVITAVHDADLIFLCTPVSSIIETVKYCISSFKSGAVLSDVASTKQEIISVVDNLLPKDVHFIGGHPMAGTEKSGYAHSTAHLFENAYYILTPLPSAANETIEMVRNVVEGIGSIPLILSPQEHDRVTGLISHFPHVLAAGLVNMAHDKGGPGNYVAQLAAGGFKDITRIASSNPDMWMDICMANRTELKQLITCYQSLLQQFESSLIHQDRNEIHAFFKQAKVFRDKIPSRPNTYMLPYYDIDIDVEDRPGIIGEIATVLGKHRLNIKNIAIINSREEEPGVLRISFPDSNSQSISREILSALGYKVFLL